MIHVVYIYFIANAFLSGERYTWNGWKYSVYLFLFGTIHYSSIILFALLKAFFFCLSKKTWIPAFLKLWFSSYYKRDPSEIKIEDVRAIYAKASWFERKFIEQMDRKYNYGILSK